MIDVLLVMKLDGADFKSRPWTLAFGSAFMMVSGYSGELHVIGGQLSTCAAKIWLLAHKAGRAITESLLSQAS